MVVQPMTDGLERLKILINSSTPIIVMETAEETHAVGMVRTACSQLNMATFEWSIADGLVRSGSNAPADGRKTSVPAGAAQPRTSLSPSAGEAARLARAMLSSQPADASTDGHAASSIYNTREPVQALANMESMTLEAVFILKDFHRHMDDPVVVRRLRDVGQKFSANRRTIVITAPAITIPPELASLVEFLELPLPDNQRLRQIIDEAVLRLGHSRTLRRNLDASGLDAVATNLRGLTEEEAERAISQAVVTRYGLTPETVTDVLEAKKELLRHSGMLEFIDASENLTSVGGLDNLKRWLAQRRGTWEDAARDFGLEPPRGVIILGVQGCGKSMCARAIAGE